MSEHVPVAVPDADTVDIGVSVESSRSIRIHQQADDQWTGSPQPLCRFCEISLLFFQRKSLLAASGKPLGDAAERQIELSIDGQSLPPIVIPRDQADVMQQIDLSSQMGTGRHALEIADRRGGSMGYQLAVSYYTPTAPSSASPQPLAVALQFDNTSLRLDESVVATALVRNTSESALPMVIVDLPIPAGFAAETAGFLQLVGEGKIEKYQMTQRSVIVYLQSLDAGKSLAIPYHLRATIAVDLTAPAAVAWEYYQPESSAHSAVTHLTVSE